jgi:hypothetical protein
MHLKKILPIFTLLFLLQGCLVFNSVSYEVNLEDRTSGTVTIEISDIRSDAMNTTELEQDKNQLFQELWKGEEFVSQMKDEGKNILERDLYISNGTLNGKVKYAFDDVSKVEGIVYQEPFYFITIQLQDSIISTNGEVIVSEGHKRIMWDHSIETLKFKMFSADVESGSLVDLTKYLDKE